MPNYSRHGGTSNVLAWSAQTSNMQPPTEEDAGAEVDEPPDRSSALTPPLCRAYHSFQKTLAYRPRDNKQSLLTKALQSQSEDENVDSSVAAGEHPRRRRSITSNTSMTSTAEFTSDTGFTTPPRAQSPSPCLVEIGAAPVRVKNCTSFATPPTTAQADATPKPASQNPPVVPSAQGQQKKRCISFACANPKPSAQAGTAGGNVKANAKATSTAVPPSIILPTSEASNKTGVKGAEQRRPCIKFACLVRPSTESHKPHPSALKADGSEGRKFVRKPSPAPEPRSPTYLRKHPRGSSSGRSPRSMNRSSAAHHSSHSPLAVRSKKYLTAKPEDLNGESSRFHEFASDAPLEDDWIRHAKSSMGQRITINDTLKKELAIRLLAKEAEEEAEQEEDNEDEEDDEAGENEEEDDENDEEDDDDDDVDENDTVEGDDDNIATSQFYGYNYDNVSDGYNTDNEIGFASSDDEDDGLVLWTVKQSTQTGRGEDYRDVGHSTLHQGGSPVFRRLSVGEHSDSSAFVAGQAIRQDKPKNRELASSGRPVTPELPDSTDFVCGTFDEDRPLEEAYLSHMAARKREKYQTIPQDIDPSFPTSDVEGESDNGPPPVYPKHQKQQQGSVDDQLWLHGELDDLHGEAERTDNRRKKEKSPRRYRSPPPPKIRGRSPAPRHLFDRHSPGRRLKSPAPRPTPAEAAEPLTALVSPRASPVEISGAGSVACPVLAFRPGLTQTKSLPRPPAIFRHQQQNNHTSAKPTRRPKANSTASTKPMHIRGAMDIVKGLEQKRQRRREKFQQKYCNRARKGQAPERRPQRGEGAERMRELGLLMAGKIEQGHYVLSI